MVKNFIFLMEVRVQSMAGADDDQDVKKNERGLRVCCLEISFGRMKAITNTLRQNSLCTNRGSNWVLPEYKSEVLPSFSTYSAKNVFKLQQKKGD
jgi:hypothetical protein